MGPSAQHPIQFSTEVALKLNHGANENQNRAMEVKGKHAQVCSPCSPLYWQTRFLLFCPWRCHFQLQPQPGQTGSDSYAMYAWSWLRSARRPTPILSPCALGLIRKKPERRFRLGTSNQTSPFLSTELLVQLWYGPATE